MKDLVSNIKRDSSSLLVKVWKDRSQNTLFIDVPIFFRVRSHYFLGLETSSQAFFTQSRLLFSKSLLSLIRVMYSLDRALVLSRKNYWISSFVSLPEKRLKSPLLFISSSFSKRFGFSAKLSLIQLVLFCRKSSFSCRSAILIFLSNRSCRPCL